VFPLRGNGLIDSEGAGLRPQCGVLLSQNGFLDFNAKLKDGQGKGIDRARISYIVIAL